MTINADPADTARLSRRVLVVDDEEGVRRIVRRILQLEHLQVVEAESGITAIEKIKADPFDLLILDLAMREMDGLATLRAVREIRPEMPTVMLSGFWNQQASRDAKAMNVKYLLQKPFEKAHLLDAVTRVLG